MLYFTDCFSEFYSYLWNYQITTFTIFMKNESFQRKSEEHKIKKDFQETQIKLLTSQFLVSVFTNDAHRWSSLGNQKGGYK